LRLRIANELLINFSKSSVHRLIKKLEFSYITPRPVHYKQDKSRHEEFKKNLNLLIKSNPEKEVFFFDESRFGTHSNIGHGWFKKGERSRVAVKLGFQSFYIYSAVAPKDGSDYTVLLPYINTESMNLFLQ